MLRNRKHIGVVLAVLAAALVGTGSASGAPLSPENFGVNVEPVMSNGQLGPGDLSLASGSDVRIMRAEVNQGTTNADQLMTLAATAHMRLAPLLGLSQPQASPAAAASAMAQFVTSFAQAYGPGGTFWKHNPTLPYMPVEDYEIGNEPNLPLQYLQDNTHLHWTDPSAYAQVYEAARAALHQVDPSGVAVVGGLADSGLPGVSLFDDERWLAALTPGQVDAVGFHPYTFPISFSQMYADTEGLRQWMDLNSMQNVPIDINEVGACEVTPQTTINTTCLPSIPSAQWGTFAAGFTEWAFCSSALNVDSMQPEYWGDMSNTDANAILALVSSEGVLTPYGTDYLNEARTLTTNGCSLVNTSPPTVSGDPAAGQTLSASTGSWSSAPSSVSYQWERCDSTKLCKYIPSATSATYQVQSADIGSTLIASVTASGPGGDVSAWSSQTGVVSSAPSPVGNPGPPPTGVPPSGGGSTPPPVAVVASAGLHLLSVRAHAGKVTIVVWVTPGSRRVAVLAKQGRHKVHLRLSHHNAANTLLTFTARLTRGKWRVTATYAPPAGYARAQAQSRSVTVRG